MNAGAFEEVLRKGPGSVVLSVNPGYEGPRSDYLTSGSGKW